MIDFCDAWFRSAIMVFGEDLNVKSVYMKDSKVNTIYHMTLQVK